MTEITASLTSGMRVSISNGRHEWLSDEPISLGGTNEGPNPYELLLSSLAACTCITVSYYCQRKGLALESVTANYEFSRVHAKDSEDSEDSDSGFMDRISSHVVISGVFDDAQRQRLTDIVKRCPVHKTLGNGVKLTDHASFS